ncbi:MAG: RluA family pseudouridine synthase [Candidatus Omnitrophica bacterium]|nr:RluA family pseudouridine synthase [Candidatus Omnitrophota bacterium]
MKEIIKTKPGDEGKRLDTFLAESLKGICSRSQIKRLIKEGRVSVDGKSRKVHYPVKASQTIDVLMPEDRKPKVLAEKISIDVVYEDDDILVVNKASGIVVHPAAGNPEHTLVNALLFHTKGKLSHLDGPRPGIVHRLDKEVSGLMVVAKTDSAYTVLVDGFKNRTISRRYIAFVKDSPPQDNGVISFPIGRALRDRKKMAVRFHNSKEAITRYKVLKRFKEYTKLELSLETGRTHQIRVHASYMGCPIIGDTKYGGGRFKRIALYAAGLTLKHPCTGEQLKFAVEIPEELKSLDRG